MMEGGRKQRMKKVEQRVTQLVSRILIAHTHTQKSPKWLQHGWRKAFIHTYNHTLTL